MTRLEVFWVPHEMTEWIGKLCSEFELRLLLFPAYPNVDKPVWLDPPFRAEQLRNATKVFLAPNADSRAVTVRRISDIQQKTWGWTVVSGGGVYDAPLILEKTEIVGKRLSRGLKWLASQLKETGFRAGARLTAPSSVLEDVPDLLFSTGALAEYRGGRAWVLDRGAQQIRYEPSSIV